MSPLLVARMVICLLEGVVSICLNFFIALMSGRSLRKGLKIKPNDLIHLIMGMNNVTLRCTQLIEEAGFWFLASLKFFKVMDVYLDWHIYIAYWLTAFLCAYYGLNISSFCQEMKRHLSTFLPHMLFLTGVGLLVMNLLYLWTVEKAFSGIPLNGSSTIPLVDSTLLYAIFLFVFGCCVPFVGVVFFLLVTVTCLLKHVWNIGYTGSNVKVYTGVINTMLMFLVLSVLFRICDIVNIATGDTSQSFTFIITWLLMLLFPSAEALIIIQASPKLRRTFPRWLCTTCNRDNVEGV